MTHAWTIDVDHVNPPGPTSRAGRRFGSAEARLLHKYRVKDADGIVYYEGRSSSDASFAPLNWAMADAGATDIEYLDPATGRWVGL